MNQDLESKVITGLGIVIGVTVAAGSLVAFGIGAVTLKEAAFTIGVGAVFAIAFFALRK